MFFNPITLVGVPSVNNALSNIKKKKLKPLSSIQKFWAVYVNVFAYETPCNCVHTFKQTYVELDSLSK